MSQDALDEGEAVYEASAPVGRSSRAQEESATQQTRLLLAESSDSELAEAVRSGNEEAFALLWERHHAAALRAARAITTRFDAEEMAQEAFVRILAALRAGRGPAGPFRPYLNQVLRNISMTWTEAARPSVPLESLAALGDPAAEFESNVEESSILMRAFATLKPEWREVLWYLEVEGVPPRHAAAFLNTTPSRLWALAYRARGALRTAWLQAHLDAGGVEPACRSVVARLAAYERGELTQRDGDQVRAHLDTCRSCPGRLLELADLDRLLRVSLVPVMPTGAVAASAGGDMLHLGLQGWPSRVRPALLVTAASLAVLAAASVLVARGDVLWPWDRTAAASHLNAPGAATSSSRPGSGSRAAGADVAAGGSSTPVPGPTLASPPVSSATPRSSPPGAAEPAPEAWGPAVQTPRRHVQTAPLAGDVTLGDSSPAAETTTPAAPTAAAAPTPSPALTTAEPPVSTPPAVPPEFAVGSVDFGDFLVAPVIAGTAPPGAVVRVFDQAGLTIVTCVASATGQWEVDLSVASPGAAQLFVALDDGALSGRTVELPLFWFAAPVAAVSALDGTWLEISGVPGASVSITLDGAPVGEVTIDPLGTARQLLVPVDLGLHDVGARYVDSVSGRQGVLTTVSVLVN